MFNTVKNTLLLGVAVLFILIFWFVWEVWKAQAILEELKDPASSTDRGFQSAEEDFREGEAYFKEWNQNVPGVSAVDLKRKYKEYKPLIYWRCIVYGDEGVEQLALNFSDHSYNEYYVTAYNQRLKTLIENKKH